MDRWRGERGASWSTVPERRGSWFARLKPAAPASAHLLAAALMWSVVGALLAAFGAAWLWCERAGWGWFTGGAVAGAVKGFLVLRRTADRIGERIVARGDGRCLGGFLSWRSWALVAVMAGTGRALRASDVPRTVVGALYLAVGIALAGGSWRLWRRLGG